MHTNTSRTGCRLLSACFIIALAVMLSGCNGKDGDAPKPANGEYYTGAMEKKPAGAAAPNGPRAVPNAPAPGKQ